MFHAAHSNVYNCFKYVGLSSVFRHWADYVNLLELNGTDFGIDTLFNVIDLLPTTSLLLTLYHRLRLNSLCGYHFFAIEKYLQSASLRLFCTFEFPSLA